ncbi:MAG: hypothetical protein V1735_01190 [Nanoarchaeota archaeon]
MPTPLPQYEVEKEVTVAHGGIGQAIYDQVVSRFGKGFANTYLSREVPFFRSRHPAGEGAINALLAEGRIPGFPRTARVMPFHHKLLLDLAGFSPDNSLLGREKNSGSMLLDPAMIGDDLEGALASDLLGQNRRAGDGITVISYFGAVPETFDPRFKGAGFRFVLIEGSAVQPAGGLQGSRNISVEDYDFLMTGAPAPGQGGTIAYDRSPTALSALQVESGDHFIIRTHEIVRPPYFERDSHIHIEHDPANAQALLDILRCQRFLAGHPIPPPGR